MSRRKYPLTTVGALIEAQLKKRGLSIREATYLCSFPNAYINKLMSGYRSLTLGNALRLEALLGINAREIMIAQLDLDLSRHKNGPGPTIVQLPSDDAAMANSTIGKVINQVEKLSPSQALLLARFLDAMMQKN